MLKDDIPKDKVLDLLSRMPQFLIDVFDSDELDASVRKIMNKYSLHVDQAKAFEDEIIRVFLGLTHPDDFLGRVRKVITTASDEELNQIVLDTNRDIFDPVRTALVEHVGNVRLGAAPKRPIPGAPPQPGEPTEITPQVPAAPQVVPAPAIPQRESVQPPPLPETQVPPERPVAPRPETPGPDGVPTFREELGEQAAAPQLSSIRKRLEQDVHSSSEERRVETPVEETSPEDVSGYKEKDPYREPIE